MTSVSAARSTRRSPVPIHIRGIVLAVVLLVSLSAAAGAATYYVDNQSASCSNSGAGTEAQPYCTISAAVAAHNGPDVTILVKPGIYREQVTIPASGANGLPFVIRATGSGVVVDGSDSFATAGQWTAASGTEWRAAGVTWNPLQVFVDGARLTPSTATPGLLPVNAFTWVSGQGLFVNLGGDNPGLHQTLVGRRLYGFNMFSKSWVNIEGFEVTRAESRCINIQTGCADLVILRNRVSFSNSYGIQANNSQRVLFEQNTVSDNNLHGIGLTAGTTGCNVRNNESFRNADPAIRRANGLYFNLAPGNVVSGNRLHDNQDSGVNLGNASNNNVFYNNRSWNNGDHGFDHLDAVGNLHTNDVAYGNFKDGFSIEGNSPNTRLYNCIGVNNGLTTNEYNLWVNDSSSVGFVSDHNVFWNSTAQSPFKYITTPYATIAGYRAASGQDAHSFQADPKFVNGAAGDFRLMAGSPAIDAGNSGVPNWPATDVDGNPRMNDPATADLGAGPVTYADIGVLEFVPSSDAPPVVVAPATVTVNEGVALVVNVTASDATAITSLTASLGVLPAGNNATFVPNASKTAGTLRWTPTFADSGTYLMTFTASNALTGTAVTTIRVVNVDRAPVVSAPGTVKSPPNRTVTFNVTVSDPDGEAIQSLVMVPVTMPPNHGATFVPNATNTGGTFTWAIGPTTGNFKVRFEARNALTGSAQTNIQVKAGGKKDLIADETGEGGDIPAVLAFSNAFPNPSRGGVEFALDLPEAADVQWAVFDLQGRMVWSERRAMAAGRTRLRWDGTTTGGAPAATGVYLVRTSVDGTTFNRRVIRF